MGNAASQQNSDHNDLLARDLRCGELRNVLLGDFSILRCDEELLHAGFPLDVHCATVCTEALDKILSGAPSHILLYLLTFEPYAARQTLAILARDNARLLHSRGCASPVTRIAPEGAV